MHDRRWYALTQSLSQRPEFGELEYPGCLPSLPPGHSAHTIWSFRDESERFHYEFNLVYGASTPSDACGPTQRLDEDLSHWSVVWPVSVGSDEERVLGRSVTFAELRKKRGSRLTFREFSSLLEMRAELDELLHPGDVGA